MTNDPGGTLKTVLREPFVELSIQATKSRRSLLLCSILCLARWDGMSISGDIGIMQTKITGLEPQLLDSVLIGGTIYFMTMLAVHGFDSLQKWKLRLTGTASADLLHSGILSNSAFVEQSTAYLQTRRVVNKLNSMLEQLMADTEKKPFITSDIKEWNELGPKLELLEKKFWRHQWQLVTRFALLDYFGPLFFGGVALVLLYCKSFVL